MFVADYQGNAVNLNNVKHIYWHIVRINGTTHVEVRAVTLDRDGMPCNEPFSVLDICDDVLSAKARIRQIYSIYNEFYRPRPQIITAKKELLRRG